MRTSFVAAFAKLFKGLQIFFHNSEKLFSTKRKKFFNEVKMFFQCSVKCHLHYGHIIYIAAKPVSFIVVCKNVQPTWNVLYNNPQATLPMPNEVRWPKGKATHL